MKKLYASQLKSSAKSVGSDFENIAKKEEFSVYLWNDSTEEIEIEQGLVFVDDIGRGGGGITEWGEIYSATKYLAVLLLQGVAVNIIYDLIKKYSISIVNIFRKSSQINQIFHFYVDTGNNSQYHFVFFSYFDEEDLKNAWNAIPDFVVKNNIVANASMDCYFDTKYRRWHMVGKRELNHSHISKYMIF